jgi:hypothetical protein
MAILSSALSILGGVVTILKKWMGMKERAEFRKAGSNEEKLRTLEGNVQAAKRKKDIEHEVSKLDASARRSALGRFVRDKSGDDH